MRSNTPFRGEAKKAKLTKTEKVYEHLARVKRREEARKKEAKA
jgi:hypothetical protein